MHCFRIVKARDRNVLMTEESVRAPLKRMKRGKAVGPDKTLVEVWRCRVEMALEQYQFSRTWAMCKAVATTEG